MIESEDREAGDGQPPAPDRRNGTADRPIDRPADGARGVRAPDSRQRQLLVRGLTAETIR
jgi:hypothetical protein